MINQSIDAQPPMVSEGIQATGNEIGTHMSVKSKEQMQERINIPVIDKNNRAYTTQDQALRMPTPQDVDREASSRGKISVSTGMQRLHQHHKDDKLPRGSAYAGITKSPYFNVDEAKPLTENEEPLIRKKTESPQKIVSSTPLQLRYEQSKLTQDKITLGRSSQDQDFYTNNDIITNPSPENRNDDLTIENANYALDSGRNLNDQSFGPLSRSKINIVPKKATAQVFTPPYQEVTEEEES